MDDLLWHRRNTNYYAYSAMFFSRYMKMFQPVTMDNLFSPPIEEVNQQMLEDYLFVKDHLAKEQERKKQELLRNGTVLGGPGVLQREPQMGTAKKKRLRRKRAGAE